jgi:hypothetical protein
MISLFFFVSSHLYHADLTNSSLSLLLPPPPSVERWGDIYAWFIETLLENSFSPSLTLLDIQILHNGNKNSARTTTMKTETPSIYNSSLSPSSLLCQPSELMVTIGSERQHTSEEGGGEVRGGTKEEQKIPFTRADVILHHFVSV